MISECKECKSEVSYFKLYDLLCKPCIEKSNSQPGRFKRLSISMPILTWLFPAAILFQLSSAWLVHNFLPNSPEAQFMFSILWLFLLFIPLLIIYIIRFFIARRRVHIALTWIILFFIFSLPIGVILALKGGGALGATSMISLLVAFKTLRLKNLTLDTI